jgi:hypothetical protein
MTEVFPFVTLIFTGTSSVSTSFIHRVASRHSFPIENPELSGSIDSIHANFIVTLDYHSTCSTSYAVM